MIICFLERGGGQRSAFAGAPLDQGCVCVWRRAGTARASPLLALSVCNKDGDGDGADNAIERV